MATLATIKGEVRRLLADLVEHAYATAYGDGTTTRFPLPDTNIVGKTTILAATALTDEAQTVTSNIVNPPYYGIVYIQGNASGIAGNVVITGTDWQGDTATDTIALNGATAAAGTTKFKTISSILLPIETHADTDTVKVYFPHSVAITVDAVDETGFWMDFDSGWCDFSSAPTSGAVIVWSYRHTQYNEADVISAINKAVSDVWAEIPRATLDTSTITASSSTYEYTLPSDCLRLIRVESRSSSSSPYEKSRNWRVIESGATKTLKLFEPPSDSDTIRLHYIAEPGTLSEDSDTLSGVGLPERAKWALIYLACFYLCEEKLLPRARTNQFKNAEGVNVPKPYEVQRIAADYRGLADLEMRKVRIGVKRWS